MPGGSTCGKETRIFHCQKIIHSFQTRLLSTTSLEDCPRSKHSDRNIIPILPLPSTHTNTHTQYTNSARDRTGAILCPLVGGRERERGRMSGGSTCRKPIYDFLHAFHDGRIATDNRGFAVCKFIENVCPGERCRHRLARHGGNCPAHRRPRVPTLAHLIRGVTSAHQQCAPQVLAAQVGCRHHCEQTQFYGSSAKAPSFPVHHLKSLTNVGIVEEIDEELVGGHLVVGFAVSEFVEANVAQKIPSRTEKQWRRRWNSGEKIETNNV